MSVFLSFSSQKNDRNLTQVFKGETLKTSSFCSEFVLSNTKAQNFLDNN